MQFPLKFQFRVVALAPQFSVVDAAGNEVCFVRQKLFRLRENIEVYSDSSKQKQISSIRANRIIDFSATYNFQDAEGEPYGSVRRRGIRSLWKTHYETWEAGQKLYDIRERNAFVKLWDSLIGEIPVLGAFTGYFLNPCYDVIDQDGKVCYTFKKTPSFFGRRFVLEETIPRDDDFLVVMSLLMMVLLERSRG